MMVDKDKTILKVEGVHLAFGNKAVLRGIDFEVREGEVVVLIGGSGSGKTSLLRCINLLNTPQLGRISINNEFIFDADLLDKGVSKVPPREVNRIRSKTGMVFQQFNLFPHMTILENVMEGPVIVKKEAPSEVEARARSLLEQMGLSEHTAKKPAQLSGGQQQRVAIARALAMRPTLMLFDEPTSALDPELVGEVLKAMVQLARSGMTMVIVTHELGFAFEIADRIVFLDGGVVAADGTPKQTLLHPEHPRLKSFVNRFHETADLLRPFLEAK